MSFCSVEDNHTSSKQIFCVQFDGSGHRIFTGADDGYIKVCMRGSAQLFVYDWCTERLLILL